MSEQRHLFRVGRSLVVALPLSVRLRLGVDRGQAVYWHTTRKGEAVLSPHEKRGGGHPEGLSLQRQLISARAEVARLVQRNEARDRTMYAEGYNVGYVQAQERFTNPKGESAEWQRRRWIYAYAFPEGRSAPVAGRKRGRPRGRKVETIPVPILSPPKSSEGADTSGGEAPQVSHSEPIQQGT
jgi:hypothetical protein